jgi:hypothetical protein
VLDHNSLDSAIDLRHREGSALTLVNPTLKGFREIFRALWTDSVQLQVQFRNFVVLVLQNAQKIEVSGSVTNAFRVEHVPEGLLKIFRTLWPNLIAVQNQIRDIVVLMLQNAQKKTRL